MKRTALILAAALAAGCARPAYVVRSDSEKAYMHGPVAQVRETWLDYAYTADALPDSLGTQDTYTVVEYNRAGNITRMDTFKGADSLHTSSEEYFYDPSGRRLERMVSRVPLQNTYSATRYDYDDEGRLTSETNENWGWRVDLGYDRHGYPRTRMDSTYNRENHSLTRYRYDRFGRLRVEKSNPGQRHFYRRGSTMISRTRYGKTETCLYDERGNLAAMTSIVKVRNARGRVVDRYPTTITTSYEYDTRGNWIRRVQLYKGDEVGVFLREIDYYDE